MAEYKAAEQQHQQEIRDDPANTPYAQQSNVTGWFYVQGRIEGIEEVEFWLDENLPAPPANEPEPPLNPHPPG